MALCPTIEDLGAEEDDDNEFTGDPRNEEEDEVQPDDPDEEDDDEEDDDDDDEVQVVTWSRPHGNRSAANEIIEFNEDIHDITGNEKADIMKLRAVAFEGDAMYAKRMKGTLLNLPPCSLPSTQQINSFELFALRRRTTTMIKKGLETRPIFMTSGCPSYRGTEPLGTVLLHNLSLLETGLKCTPLRVYKLTSLWELPPGSLVYLFPA